MRNRDDKNPPQISQLKQSIIHKEHPLLECDFERASTPLQLQALVHFHPLF